jgi:uncharacterized protein YndB with AHSA1/START domain
MSGSSVQQLTSEKQMTFVRQFEAPRELVFSVWTDPKHITHWWGPEGFSTTTSLMELKAGGDWIFVMHGPDGTDYKNHVHFSEVRAPELLRYHHASADESADVSFEVRVDFRETAAGTEVSMSMSFPTAEEMQRVIEKYGAEEGARQTLSRLAQHLNNIQGESNE